MSPSTTRALLACGAVAPLASLLTFHLDMVFRTGYDPLRHAPSLMMTGERGWVQIANFVVTGALMIACAVGVRRALPAGRASRWGPPLVAIYGTAMIATGVFVTDPQMGYPPGTPPGLLPGVNAGSSWHGNLHWVSVFVMYAAATLACFAFARRFAAEPGGRVWAALLAGTGVLTPVIMYGGSLVLQPLSLSGEWYAALDGIASRLVIPLGWIWAALVSYRLLRTRATAEVNA
ncbi:DUF998 domain-containing protein [Nonomuraea sp. KC401]|uniref:DUF998 domain-containing protein n=1 Tax=unclassified Nonomuraea TaxID=2593643 RepID=UPI0010FD4EB4|nr:MULTISPECIES: DUF998 domain-containing protein [unclassified Nonomuraea]NBE93980.1 DUF998 domain-containing protein [Nonomuraea sp. K271]TLF80229.1 DUF998 domain-containing protein [Nonomuraea sp. KC401]